MQAAAIPLPFRALLRDAGGLLAGLVAVFILAGIADQLFHALGLLPNPPMQESRLGAIAFACRTFCARAFPARG